ncbi:hypothetical protein F2Q69_00046628 [Brassica cretica]|uniref:F-box protein At3g26010-like beta-propeller domain-containing protein n=1 Tax=Brassica cretica TaxID=69181 RepID=A0A8S9Q2H2_BRACR|nr:hypothetical protein F2Q69_00046628 [Brassica cretica]
MCILLRQGHGLSKTLRSPSPLQRAGLNRPLNLNGLLYVWEKRLDDYSGPGALVSHDFYGEQDDDQCRVRRCLSSSGGDVIYVDRRLKVWKLKSDNNSDGEWWQLTREEINMASVGFDVNCFPLEVNPTRLILILSIYGVVNTAAWYLIDQIRVKRVNSQRKTIDINADKALVDFLTCQLPPFSIRVVVTLQLPNLQSLIQYFKIDNIST